MKEGIEARLPSLRTIVLVGLGVVAALWIVPTIVAALGSINISGVERPYLLIFLFVWWDALIPLFPSESLLNTASTLVAAGDLDLHLWALILIGAAGAIIGDSSLYWLSRTVGHKYMADKLARAKRNPKIATGFEVLGMNAPLLLVGGRFVPGMRFVVNATMGLERYPYSRFLPYSMLGGFCWAAFNCGFSYLVGTKVGQYAVLSLFVSFAVTTGILAVLYRSLKRRYAEQAAERAPALDLDASPG